jgi:hypothetical protein
MSFDTNDGGAKQINTTILDVFSTNNIRQAALVDHFAQLFLSLDQWKLPQIATVEVQQIEGVENWGATTEQQFVKDTPAFRVQANKFAVDHRVLYFQLGEIVTQVLKTLVRIPFARDQFAVAIPDVRQRSESIVLEFEEEVWVVEWSADKAQLDGVEPGWAHINRMRSERGADKRMKGEERLTFLSRSLSRGTRLAVCELHATNNRLTTIQHAS